LICALGQTAVRFCLIACSCGSQYTLGMIANEVFEAIKRLNPKEQLAVIRFAYQPDAERRLTGKELSGLAERMVKTTDPAEGAIIREAMIRGFYSVAAGRAGSRARNKRAIAKRNRKKRSATRV
jgi:hypothetical protein